MAYAVAGDVLARAGRFAGRFDVAGRRPNIDDLDDFLGVVSAAIDDEIRAHGYDPASVTDDVAAALRDVAAWAVLIRALPGTSPGDDEVAFIVEQAKEIVSAAGFAALATGGHGDVLGAIATLEAGAGGGGAGTSAGSLWDTLETGSGWSRFDDDVVLVNGQPPDGADADAAGPQFTRGMTL